MKVMYDGIEFDSELEISYFKHLSKLHEEEKIGWFAYLNLPVYKKHPIPVNLGRRKSYVPDFLYGVIEDKEYCIYIIELKGYAKWSANEDNNLADFCKHKVATDQEFLREWIRSLGFLCTDATIKYRRMKHNKTYGFVDYDWKNPNSVSNQRKIKVEALTKELKEANEKIKNYERYFSYLHKEKLTKSQREWKDRFEMEALNNE